MNNDNRQQVAATILAGLLSNPNIVAACPRRGWGVANCSERQLVEYADWLSKIVSDVAGNEQQAPAEIGGKEE